MKFADIRQRAKQLKRQVFVVYLAARHPDTPWYAKLFAAVIVAYAFSPIDLVPDFVPVLGYLDDVILIPLGIALLLRMIPAEILEACRADAEALAAKGKRVSIAAAVVIVLIWTGLCALFVWWLWPEK